MSNPRYAIEPFRILWETASCCGGERTKCHYNNDKAKPGTSLCNAEFHWEVFSNDLTKVHIWIRGNHGTEFTPGAQKEIISAPLKKMIVELIGIGMKPNMICQAIHHKITNNELDFHHGTTNPDKTQITNFVKNFNKRCKNASDIHCAQNWLEDPENFDHIEFPLCHEGYLEKTKNWTIVLSHPTFLEQIRQHGKHIIGLDNIFKSTKYTIPVWSVVCEDSNHEGIPLAWILGSDYTVDILQNGLQYLKQGVEQKDFQEEWKPDVIIDHHDNTERAAIAAMGWKHCMCPFHFEQSTKKILKEFVKDDDADVFKKVNDYLNDIMKSKNHDEMEENANILRHYLKNEKQHNKLLNKLEEQWLCSDWLQSWTDVERPSSDHHLDNSFSVCCRVKTTFEKNGHLFLNGNGGYRLSALIKHITGPIHVHYMKQLRSQHHVDLVEIPNTQQKVTKSQRTLRDVADRASQLLNGTHSPLFVKVVRPNAGKDGNGEIVLGSNGKPVKDGVFLFDHQNKQYLLDIPMKTCTCIYFMITGKVCKHMLCWEWSQKKMIQIYNDQIHIKKTGELPTTSKFRRSFRRKEKSHKKADENDDHESGDECQHTDTSSNDSSIANENSGDSGLSIVSSDHDRECLPLPAGSKEEESNRCGRK